jgi:hypothetical protein
VGRRWRWKAGQTGRGKGEKYIDIRVEREKGRGDRNKEINPIKWRAKLYNR